MWRLVPPHGLLYRVLEGLCVSSIWRGQTKGTPKQWQTEVNVKLSRCLIKHHVMKTYWWAEVHLHYSWPQHSTGISGQYHAPGALPLWKQPPVPIWYEVEWAPEPAWPLWNNKKFIVPAGNQTQAERVTRKWRQIMKRGKYPVCFNIIKSV
jgi:hypothetical protein